MITRRMQTHSAECAPRQRRPANGSPLEAAACRRHCENIRRQKMAISDINLRIHHEQRPGQQAGAPVPTPPSGAKTGEATAVRARVRWPRRSGPCRWRPRGNSTTSLFRVPRRRDSPDARTARARIPNGRRGGRPRPATGSRGGAPPRAERTAPSARHRLRAARVATAGDFGEQSSSDVRSRMVATTTSADWTVTPSRPGSWPRHSAQLSPFSPRLHHPPECGERDDHQRQHHGRVLEHQRHARRHPHGDETPAMWVARSNARRRSSRSRSR